MSHPIHVGDADQIAYFRAYDTDGTAKVDLTSATTALALTVYRPGATAVSIASLSDKAADNTTHADGAIRHVAGNRYTVDLPDAACADQVPSIEVQGSYTGGVIEGDTHPITGYSASDGVRLGLTAIPNAAADAAGGLPISDAGGLAMDGLSTFDASSDEVTTDSASRTASQATGFATPTNVSDAQAAIINAINAVNTGAARYISIATGAAYEIPDSGSVVYPIEIRTFDADGEPVAIDSAADPTVTVTRTTDSTDLSSDLSAITSPATGVYRMTFSVASTATVAPLRIDASGAIATVSRSTSAYPVITDAVAVDFTSADRTKLNLLAGTDGATLATSQPNYAPAKAGDEMDLVDAPNSTAVTAIQDGLSTLDATAAQSAASAAITAYDPPTRAEATADKDEILTRGSTGPWTSGSGGSGTTNLSTESTVIISKQS